MALESSMHTNEVFGGDGTCACLSVLRALGVAALAAACMWLCLPAQARASVASGALSQPTLSCFGEEQEEVAACAEKVPYGLSYAYQIVVSPNGEHAYSVGVKGDLIEYSRNLASGSLSVIGCFTSQALGEPECAGENVQMGVEAVGDPSAVAISPDGRSLYVTSQLNNTIAEFEVDESGLLEKIGCITHEGTLPECEAATGARGLKNPYGVTVSPEGENVYVTAFGEEAVGEFKRNSETGVLTQLVGNECIGSATSSCPKTTIGLGEDIGIVASPDGKDVYVAAGAKSAKGDVATLARGAEGALEPLEGEERCIGSISECAAGAHIDGVEDLAVSPDGKNVYGTSASTNAVIELQPTATGALEQLAAPNKCVSTESLSGCQEVVGIAGAVGVAISPGGEDVYASGQGEGSVASFERDAETGVLTQLATPCLTEQPSGCGSAEFDKRVGLAWPRRLTVSPDGTNVYVASQSSHAIAVLARTVTPTLSRIDLASGSTEGGAVVYIKGRGFAIAEGVPLAVTFGGVAAKKVEVQSATLIVAESPAGTDGSSVPVHVENAAGSSAEVASGKFAYTDAPAVAGVTPDVGREDGGSEVTITGANLQDVTQVYFGGTPAAGFTVTSAETIVATSPRHKGGEVDVTVQTPQGTSEAGVADKFTYVHGTPVSSGGLVLSGYCEAIGDTAVTLERVVGGPGFAYENWACVTAGGAEVPIANTGAAPSMANACELANLGATTFAYPSSPESAFAWGCYTIEPSTVNEEEEAKQTEQSSTSATTAKIAANIAAPIGGEIPPATMPQPVLAVSGNVAPISGMVLVRLPGSAAFVPLASLRQIPFGTVIEATHGHVGVTTAQPNGTTQTGEFFEGEFVLKQGRNGQVIAELTGGNFSVCPTARERAHRASASAATSHASTSHVVRKLWANAHGSFSTKGNYAAGAVQGTEWLTEDLCDGTVIRVTRDRVAVTNLVNHHHVEVTTGHKYLAKAP
jgi:DNA-binding beta-propeller fold protein YncE